MSELSYELSFAGVPFVLDEAKVYRGDRVMFAREKDDDDDVGIMIPRKHQPLADLVEELNRRMPTVYLQDVGGPGPYPGRNLGAIAHSWEDERFPGPEVRIGDWYYPAGAQRFSVFRMLATSLQYAAMLRAVSYRDGARAAPAAFVMKNVPKTDIERPDNAYTLSTLMYMLPGRPLAEHAGAEGVYLVTLVDERYYWQYRSVSLAPSVTSTWDDLLTALASALGVTLSYSTISDSYGRPDPDSQLRCQNENAALLLDAVCANLGLTVCRLMDGTYALRTPSESQTIIDSNRGPYRYLRRAAGGDMFTSGQAFFAGDIQPAQNTILPTTVRVSFPKYVAYSDPVPHYLNVTDPAKPRGSWFSESYGDTYAVDVPVTSAGPLAVGMAGVSGVHHVHTTAKAYYASEAGAVSGAAPDNASGLGALALKVAQDYWDTQACGGLDEKYEGTRAWVPEGAHDIIWTWSVRSRQASTRVMSTHWNYRVQEMQHAGTPLSGLSTVPPGQGGPPVAQTHRDGWAATDFTGGNLLGSSGLATKLYRTLNSGGSTPLALGASYAEFQSVDYLPTQNRWKALVGGEVILFEGTSGGLLIDALSGGPSFQVSIVYRGMDGTLEDTHADGTDVTQQVPNTVYGVNLAEHGRGAFVYPSYATSGGVNGAVAVPQTQTVRVLCNSGATLRGILHYSGRVEGYDYTQNSGNKFRSQELVWVVERNDLQPLSGQRYGGQFVGYSASGPVAPVYLINKPTGSTLINVANQDGSKRYSGIDLLIFDETDGFALSGTGTQVRVDFSGTGGSTSVPLILAGRDVGGALSGTSVLKVANFDGLMQVSGDVSGTNTLGLQQWRGETFWVDTQSGGVGSTVYWSGGSTNQQRVGVTLTLHSSGSYLVIGHMMGSFNLVTASGDAQGQGGLYGAMMDNSGNVIWDAGPYYAAFGFIQQVLKNTGTSGIPAPNVSEASVTIQQIYNNTLSGQKVWMSCAVGVAGAGASSGIKTSTGAIHMTKVTAVRLPRDSSGYGLQI